MDFRRINKTSFALGTGAVMLVGAALAPGLALAQTGDDGSDTPSVERPFHERGHRGHAGGPFGFFKGGEDLAEALGVTVDELRAAAESVREDLRPEERPTVPPTEEEREARRAEFQAAFASALGVTVDELESAIEAVKAEKVAAVVERIQQKVEDGVLTQEQADALIEAIESGERPPFGPRGFGRFGGLGRFSPDAGVTPDA